MIKRYTSLFNFMKEMPQLKDGIVIFPFNIEEQMMMLKSHQYRAFINDTKRLNIRIIIEKEKYYEDNGIVKKTR